MPRVKCINKECKFNNHDGKCIKKSIKLGYNGCESFEKNMIYYIHLVWEELEHTNMIFPFKLTPDLRIGLFYVMELYGLKFSNNTWGNDSFLTLHRDDVKNGDALSYKDIVDIDIDMDKLKYHNEKFMNGELPPYKAESIDKNNTKEVETIKSKIEEQPFGWLSPTGEFIESDWGTHEESAIDICKNNKWEDEYYEWHMKNNVNERTFCRDFLHYVKGYALIHNPSMIGGYIVTYTKDLTKKQKDFLYSYFLDMGDVLRAESFITD